MSEVGEHLGRSDGPELGRGLSESAVITGRMGASVTGEPVQGARPSTRG